jgi:hypothetical protein
MVFALVLALVLALAPSRARLAAAQTAGLGVLVADGGSAQSLEPDDGSAAEDPDAAYSAEDYDRVEKAGLVESPTDYHADGWIDHFQSGYDFGQVDSVVILHMRSGHKAVVGADYVIYREEGELGEQEGSGQDAGMLLKNVGVLRVMRVAGDSASARVVKQYWNMIKGDLVRLREPQRRRYYALLDRTPPARPKALRGEVVGVMPPTLFAVKDDYIYLNLGVAKGVLPGMRMTVLGDLDPDDFGPDDYDSSLPMRPIVITQPASDDTGVITPTGGIATVEVVNATAGACVARVLDCTGDVRVGDHVRYP